MQNKELIFQKAAEIKSLDPRVRVSKESICLTPSYFSYYFLKNIIFSIGLAYAIFKIQDLIYTIFGLLLIGSFIFFIFSDLRYYNTVKINIVCERVLISPNSIFGLFVKKIELNYSDVKYFNLTSNIDSTGFWYKNRRYFILANLSNGKKVTIISVKQEATATRIQNLLNFAIQLVKK
jgi:hypothetical protein